jgi:hypothetical protein
MRHPIGTVLHGYFVLPQDGDRSIAPPDKNATRYVLPQTHAVTLEDDFSFYQRQQYVTNRNLTKYLQKTFTNVLL